MIERIFILLALATAVALAFLLWRYLQRRRLRALALETPFATLVPQGRPAVVAFSLPTCSDCRTRQAPALQRLSAAWGDQINLHTLNAAEHSRLAERLGLLTVPSTVVLDAQGVVRYVNQGFADEQRLCEQIATLG
ncbi:thioredoxin family protein [Candidatus Gracilibacteria bacterium]|nr:thioredoxin family protein [Candidatus Gracilibacteria bacterium]